MRGQLRGAHGTAVLPCQAERRSIRLAVARRNPVAEFVLSVGDNRSPPTMTVLISAAPATNTLGVERRRDAPGDPDARGRARQSRRAGRLDRADTRGGALRTAASASHKAVCSGLALVRGPRAGAMLEALRVLKQAQFIHRPIWMLESVPDAKSPVFARYSRR